MINLHVGPVDLRGDLRRHPIHHDRKLGHLTELALAGGCHRRGAGGGDHESKTHGTQRRLTRRRRETRFPRATSHMNGQHPCFSSRSYSLPSVSNGVKTHRDGNHLLVKFPSIAKPEQASRNPSHQRHRPRHPHHRRSRDLVMPPLLAGVEGDPEESEAHNSAPAPITSPAATERSTTTRRAARTSLAGTRRLTGTPSEAKTSPAATRRFPRTRRVRAMSPAVPRRCA